MSRLTKKEPNNLSCHHFRRCEYLRNGTPRVETLNKLGKLEDLEEQLGCTFETIIKATTNGIIDFEGKEHEVVFGGYYLFVVEEDELRHAFALKNYRKSWWLRGERDENN